MQRRTLIKSTGALASVAGLTLWGYGSWPRGAGTVLITGSDAPPTLPRYSASAPPLPPLNEPPIIGGNDTSRQAFSPAATLRPTALPPNLPPTPAMAAISFSPVVPLTAIRLQQAGLTPPVVSPPVPVVSPPVIGAPPTAASSPSSPAAVPPASSTPAPLPAPAPTPSPTLPAQALAPAPALVPTFTPAPTPAPAPLPTPMPAPAPVPAATTGPPALLPASVTQSVLPR